MHLRLLPAALLATACAAHATPIELYAQPQLRAPMLGLDAATARLGDYNFNDRPQSLRVRSGQWELCTDADFRGQCRVFGPGEYATLPPPYAGSISSVRPAQGAAVAGSGWPSAKAAVGVGAVTGALTGGQGDAHGAVVLYRDARFGGPSLAIHGATPDLRQQGFNDEMSSFEVRSGAWQLCEDMHYGGACQVYGPGRYDVSQSWNDRLSSLRPAGADITLFRDVNGGGQRLAISGATPSLVPQGFNDVASSVEIASGSWQLCSDVNYRGHCITLGPGRHNLSGAMHDSVSSLRPAGGGWGTGLGQGQGWGEPRDRGREVRN